jgi:hypothetical protein
MATAAVSTDPSEAIRRLLSGLSRGLDANELVVAIADLHPGRDTFPGEVFMALAADALDLAGFDRLQPIHEAQLLPVHLPEVEFRGKENRRIQYAVLTAFAVHGGLEPDLLDDVTFWIDDYWQYALFAAVALIRSGAAAKAIAVDSLLEALAARHSVDIS